MFLESIARYHFSIIFGSVLCSFITYIIYDKMFPSLCRSFNWVLKTHFRKSSEEKNALQIENKVLLIFV